MGWLSETSLNPLQRIFAFAAAVEVGTGLVLAIDPAIVVTLLLGVDVSGVGIVLGRCFGIALLTLVLACWPGRPRAESGSPAFRAMLVYKPGCGSVNTHGICGYSRPTRAALERLGSPRRWFETGWPPPPSPHLLARIVVHTPGK